MIRRIIQIDREKCTGCGLCAKACHEGAIDMVNGKAHLAREHYCDGLGDCLPVCPADAIHFVERQAPAYDEAAVLAAKARKQAACPPHAGGCPGSRSMMMDPSAPSAGMPVPGQLRQWPVQLKLLPVTAPYYDGCDLLIAADCTAYAFGDFHRRFIQGHTVIIACPKLDGEDYSEKLTAIFMRNDIRSVHVVRMQVPCCGGLVRYVTKALEASGKHIPCEVTVIGTDGHIIP